MKIKKHIGNQYRNLRKKNFTVYKNIKSIHLPRRGNR